MAGNIKGLFVEIGADTSKLEAAFRSADNSIKSTQSQLRDLNRELKLNPGNTDLLRDKQKALASEISNTKDKLSALEQAQKEMDAEGVDKNSEAYRNLQTEIDTTKAKLGDLEKEQKDFGSVGAQKIAAVGEKVKGVGEKMADIGGKMTAGFTAPVIAGATAAVSAYGDVDKQFNLVKQTMGTASNSAEDFRGLWDQMGASAKNSVFGMQDAADATLNFARQGFSAKQATDMLTPAMSLAAGTETDLSETTAGLGNALKMFGADSSEAANYANILARAQAQANTDTSNLFEAMSVAGPICKTVGWNIQDLATITDVFGNAGISGSEGATALKTGLARLAAPAKDGATYMDALGLSTGDVYAIFNDDGSMKSMTEVLGNLNKAFSGLTQEEELQAASAIFGKNQMAKWMTLIHTSPSDVDSLRSALDNCTGSADDMANALMSGTGGSIEQLKSTFDVLKVELGQQLAPAFEPVISGVTNLMNSLMNLSPETQQMILRVTAVVAAIGPLLLVGGKMLVGIGQLMTYAPLIQAAFTGVLGPIALVTAAVAGAVAAGVLLYKNWDTIKAKASEVGSKIKGVWTDIQSKTTEVFGDVKSTVTTKWNEVKTGIANSQLGQTAATVWDAVKTTTQNSLTSIRSAYDEHGGGMEGAVAAVGEAIQQSFTSRYNVLNQLTDGRFGDMVSTAQTKMNDFKSDVEDRLGDVKQAFTDKLGDSLSTAKSKLGDIEGAARSKIDSMKRIISDGLDRITGFFRDIHWSLPSIKLPHFSISGNFSLRPPSVPHFSVDWYDKGGIFSSPTVIGVGEKRPEFVGALDDLREIVREESGRGASDETMKQMVGLLAELVQLARKPRQIEGTLDADGLRQQIYSGTDDYLTRQVQKHDAVWA